MTNAASRSFPTERETPDIETASDGYARRFTGPVGDFFLELQGRTIVRLLTDLPRGATILDVGGGHAQLTPWLVDAGFEVVVLSSTRACGVRLSKWTDSGVCHSHVGDLVNLPYSDRAFDAAVSFRQLPHLVRWTSLMSELCRVAPRVVVDFPSWRSVNVLSEAFFSAKKRIEGNTRPFTLFHRAEIAAEFRKHQFRVTRAVPQFFFPMVLHRAARSATLTRLVEMVPRWTGLTLWLGSPVIVRADAI